MVKQIAFGFLVGYTAVSLLHGCSGGQPRLQCEIDAVRQLPPAVVSDPDTLTVGDVRGLVQRLKFCRTADAGAGQ